MDSNRLTKKFADKVILPFPKIHIKSKEDFDKFLKIQKEYEDNTIKLSSYEDIGSVEEFKLLKAKADKNKI